MPDRGNCLVVAAALLLGGALFWTLRPFHEPLGGSAGESGVDRTEGRRIPAASAAAATPGPEAVAPPPVALPSPIDLAHVDRDLDLHGDVVRKDGTPVPGAEVRAFRNPWDRLPSLTMRGTAEPVAGAATRSSVDGTFSLRLARGDLVTLRACGPGFAPAELRRVQAGERVRVVLEPGVALLVTTRDESGAPVPGKHIRLTEFRNGEEPSTSRTASTGSDGTCAFEDLPASAQVVVDYPEGGCGDAEPQVVNLPATGEVRLDVVVSPGRVLRGRVTDADAGTPLPGALVGPGYGVSGGARTGVDGSFTLPGMPVRRAVVLEVVAEGYVRQAVRIPESDTAADVVLDFALCRGFSVRGRVLAEAGTAAAGAWTRAEGHRSDGVAWLRSEGCARTGSDGRFTINDLDRTISHRLTISAEGAARAEVPVPLPRAGEESVDLGDILIATPRSVEGVLLDAAGSPVPRRNLMLFGPRQPDDSQAEHNDTMELRVTDDLGRFRFPDLAPGLYALSAQVTNEPEITMNLAVPPDGDVLGVVLRSGKTRTLSVRVVDGAGRALPGVLVQALSLPNLLFGGSALTGADGVARLETSDRAVEVSVLWLAAALEERYLRPGESVRIEAGESAEATITLPEGAPIRGVVLDPQGKPLAGAWVRGIDGGRGMGGTRSEIDGTFRIVVPAGATLDLVVDGTGGPGPQPVDLLVEGRADRVAAGTSGIAIRCSSVEAGRSVSFRASTPEGVPLAGVRVELTSTVGEGTVVAMTDAEGLASVANLRARRYAVLVPPSGDWLGPRGFDVFPEGQEVAFAMRPSDRVAGVVVHEDGTPAAGARITLEEDDAAPVTAVAGTDGRFAILVPRTTEGSFTLEVSATDGAGAFAGRAQGVRPGQVGVRIVVER